jgi:hypothetical protein
MNRVSKIENTSENDVNIELKGGLKVTLKPRTALHNVEITNIGCIRGKIKVTEDLSEIQMHGGKTRIDERAT